MLRLAAACAALGGVLALEIAVPVDGNDFLVSLRDGLPPSEMASEARIGARAVLDALRDAGGLGGGCPADDRDCLVEVVAGYIAAREDATRARTRAFSLTWTNSWAKTACTSAREVRSRRAARSTTLPAHACT